MQEQLFQIIKTHYHNKEQLIADLMEILNVGRSAVYKRISGTILLNVEELNTLVQHFQIDPSVLFDKPSGHLNFIFPPLYKGIENQGDFLGPIIEELKILANTSGSKIRFLATGFPIFYFFFQVLHFSKFGLGTRPKKTPPVQLERD